jgi:renalase
MTTPYLQADTAVIGAGLTGSLIARGLSASGDSVAVLDKGRGPGGRLSVRRADIGSFAHGCPLDTVAGWLEALPPDQREALDLVDAGHAGDSRVQGLPKHLLGRISARFGALVAAIERIDGRWTLRNAEGAVLAKAHRLVLTAPAPQSAALLAALQPDWSNRLGALRIAPAWALLLAQDAAQVAPVWTAPASIHVQTQDALPGTELTGPAVRRWVVRLDDALSADLLEAEPSQVLEVVLRPLGLQPTDFLHASAHRWRYARVLDPQPEPLWVCETTALAVCGDAFAGASAAEPGHADLARCAASAAALLALWQPRATLA